MQLWPSWTACPPCNRRSSVRPSGSATHGLLAWLQGTQNHTLLLTMMQAKDSLKKARHLQGCLHGLPCPNVVSGLGQAHPWCQSLRIDHGTPCCSCDSRAWRPQPWSPARASDPGPNSWYLSRQHYVLQTVLRLYKWVFLES